MAARAPFVPFLQVFVSSREGNLEMGVLGCEVIRGAQRRLGHRREHLTPTMGPDLKRLSQPQEVRKIHQESIKNEEYNAKLYCTRRK